MLMLPETDPPPKKKKANEIFWIINVQREEKGNGKGEGFEGHLCLAERVQYKEKNSFVWCVSNML